MPKTRKTERLYQSASLAGESRAAAVQSFEVALTNLERDAVLQGREPLFDTLEVSIEREQIEERTLASIGIIQTNVIIQVSAEAVKR